MKNYEMLPPDAPTYYEANIVQIRMCPHSIKKAGKPQNILIWWILALSNPGRSEHSLLQLTE